MDNLPLLVAAAGAGFVAYKAFAPEPTIDIVRAPIHTDAAKVGELCSRVRSNAERWNAVSPAKKLQFLKKMLQCHKQSLATVADKSARVRGWQDTELEGTGFVMGTALTSSYLYGLIEMYEALVAGGMPKETAARQVGDCEVKTVAPRGLWMKVSSPQVVELWSEPGKKLVQKKGAPMGDGGLVGVMNPGNFECPTDVLYQMFVEGNVCVAKTHPGNAESMNETMSVLFGELQKLGFIEITTGGADVGGAILNDANVTSWMMTGGCATFNAITFGGDPKSNKKRLDKECHAELGAASPYLVVPSNDWTDADIQYQATILACFKFVNVGAVCASPQSIIIDRNWSRAQQFVDELQSALRKMPAIKPYYAGSQQRLTALKQNCTSAISFDNGIVFVPDMDGEGGGGDYLLETEVFAPGMGIKYVSSEGDAKRFLQEAAILANDKCFGSLSCTIVVPPTTLKALGRAAVDEAVNRFKWGTVGINLWAGFAAGNPYGTWGAPPGRHSDEDIQSGKGLMGNCLRFENIYRSTIKGEWNDPIMMKLLNPALGKSSKLATAYGTMAARQTVGSLLSTLGAAFF